MELFYKIRSKVSNNIHRFSKSSRSRYGIPFILFVLVGSFGLKEFTAIRYRYRDGGVLVHDEAKKVGIEIKKPGEVTLDTVYDTVKNIDIDHWENKRGPRPWEESSNQ